MSRSGAFLLLGVAIASLVLVTRREAASPSSVPARKPAARPQQPRLEKTVDPATIRDVFRFAPRHSAAAPPLERRASTPLAIPAPSPDPVRLVGIVRRQGQLLAAFAVDGDVVLAAAGATVGGMTVLGVGEDGVHVRRRDGTEERLVLP